MMTLRTLRGFLPRTSGALSLALLLVTAAVSWAQGTGAALSGSIRDEQGGLVGDASVGVRHVETNVLRTSASSALGTFRFTGLQPGPYELTIEAPGFRAYLRSGITLALGQEAVVGVELERATIEEILVVTADASLLDTTTSEVGVRFDSRRVGDLPIVNSRDVFALALSAPGVSQLNSGQNAFAAGTNFSVNGMRTRSNAFMIDGQDNTDPLSGRRHAVNNSDLIQEVRLITNQFNAEYGRSAGSVTTVITRSGTNAFRGSAFAFHNNNALNARSNLDKNAGRQKAPWRLETQVGGTLGGPILRDRTFFFGSYLRWTDRRLGAGTTLNGAPTEAGRQVLQSAVGHLPQIQALLRFLPAAQAPIAKTATFTYEGERYTVPLGALTGSANVSRNSLQTSGRVDHRRGNSSLGGRYLWNDNELVGVASQVTPSGYLTVNPSSQHAFTGWWTRTWGSNLLNETRVGFLRVTTSGNAQDPSSAEIPSIEIAELGLTGFFASANRTAIGLAVNLPGHSASDAYQFVNTASYLHGRHAFKAGVDAKINDYAQSLGGIRRGQLSYPTLQRYVDDVAEVVRINRSLPGGMEVQLFEWTDVFAFVQDEWRVARQLTLNLGLRYETPGNAIASLYPVSDRIVAAHGGNPEFGMLPRPGRDTNNWQPRVGFNWNPHTTRSGVVRLLTGGDRLTVRGGYARTHDYAFLQMFFTTAVSFPFVASINEPNLPGSFVNLPTLQPAGVNPRLLQRTTVSDDFRAPVADQFSLEVQRALTQDVVLRVGYVGTKGSALFQSVDRNPTIPFSSPVRQDPTRGTIQERSNAASSSYHSLQTGLERRFSGRIGAGVHYTWSKYLDTASDVFNISGGEVAIAQDSYDLRADRARSSYDRPHRFTGNLVYELPFAADRPGLISRVLGGWSLATLFSFQSGSPFTVLNGSDPTGSLAGISGVVGTATRPNLNTDLPLSKMTIPEILAAGGAGLFRPLCGNPSAICPGERVGNVGRNTLRSDGINNVDFSVIKNTRFGGRNLQIRLEMFNAFNSRDFGIPESRINSPNFLNQWGTDGGSRRIWGAARYTF